MPHDVPNRSTAYEVLGTPALDVHAAYKRLGTTMGDEDRGYHHTSRR